MNWFLNVTICLLFNGDELLHNSEVHLGQVASKGSEHRAPSLISVDRNGVDLLVFFAVVLLCIAYLLVHFFDKRKGFHTVADRHVDI